MYHEELESLSLHLKGLKRIRFWMTFGEAFQSPQGSGKCRDDWD